MNINPQSHSNFSQFVTEELKFRPALHVYSILDGDIVEEADRSKAKSQVCAWDVMMVRLIRVNLALDICLKSDSLPVDYY